MRMKINSYAHENTKTARAVERKLLLCFTEDMGLGCRNQAFLPKTGGLTRFKKRLNDFGRIEFRKICRNHPWKLDNIIYICRETKKMYMKPACTHTYFVEIVADTQTAAADKGDVMVIGGFSYAGVRLHMEKDF